MTWLLLFGLTAFAAVLPLLPAMFEWRWPRDVAPLHVGVHDALDPPVLARSFVARLADARARGQSELGRLPIAQAQPNAAWPLSKSELQHAATRRIWHCTGDAQLPAGVSFLAEVASDGSIRAAADVLYRALSAGSSLHLGSCSTVLRWAHGAQVVVASGCHLAGRVTADLSITIADDTRFTLLHAPTVRFGCAQAQVASETFAPVVAQGVYPIGLPEPVVWDSIAARGTCGESLDVGAHRTWRGDLVCGADLTLGTGCSAHGSLKAHGNIVADAGCQFEGSIFSEASIQLGPRCVVRGALISETEIQLGAGCVIGAPERPATVAAPRITIAPGVVVHGTVWAGVSGHMPADAALPVMAGSLEDALAEAPREALA